jgi:hypothetical protein
VVGWNGGRKGRSASCPQQQMLGGDGGKRKRTGGKMGLRESGKVERLRPGLSLSLCLRSTSPPPLRPLRPHSPPYSWLPAPRLPLQHPSYP